MTRLFKIFGIVTSKLDTYSRLCHERESFVASRNALLEAAAEDRFVHWFSSNQHLYIWPPIALDHLQVKFQCVLAVNNGPSDQAVLKIPN